MDDDGQLMMLAGIVLTISFILTSLTLAQVSSLEREAAAEAPTAMIAEWRFLHDRLGSNLDTAIGPDTTKEAFLSTILPTVQATFRSVMAEKGYDLALRAADDPAIYGATGAEPDRISGANYDAWTWDGKVRFTHAVDPDEPQNGNIRADREDGVIWQKPCAEAGPASGCIGGLYIYVKLTDGATSLQESILFATNQP